MVKETHKIAIYYKLSLSLWLQVFAITVGMYKHFERTIICVLLPESHYSIVGCQHPQYSSNMCIPLYLLSLLSLLTEKHYFGWGVIVSCFPFTSELTKTFFKEPGNTYLRPVGQILPHILFCFLICIFRMWGRGWYSGFVCGWGYLFAHMHVPEIISHQIWSTLFLRWASIELELVC